MKIKLIAIGKTDNSALQALIDDYLKRLSFYIKFELEIITVIKNVKNLSEALQKEKEGEMILSKISPMDHLILLDEKGKSFSSMDFSSFIEKKAMQGKTRIIFVIGGAFGFSPEVYDRANELVSLSKMTFSHQLIRLIFLEQLYRSFTILKGEKYHHC